MIVLRRFFAAAGLCLLLNAGCVEEKKPVSPVLQPQKYESVYKDIELLAGKVAGLSEKVFPGGGVINFGKSDKGLGRYLEIGVLEEEGKKALDLRLYMGSNAETEELLNRGIASGDYALARSLLEGSGWSMSGIHDSKIDGIDPTDSNDFTISRREKGEPSTLRSTDLYHSLEAVNGLYKTILKSTAPILEERLKPKN